MEKELAVRAADNIRILTAAMVEKAKSGHPGGAMGAAEFIHILYAEFLRFDPTDMKWANRDRFYLDPGHMSPMLYAVLTLTGLYTMEDLKNFRQWGSITPGHPERNVLKGVENTSGPLGLGHTMAVGAAIAERFLAARFGEWMSHKIYTFISDGGIQEEISQGAGRIAGYLKLHNLIMFYDSNDIQLSTETGSVSNEDTALKYEAWGWNVLTIDGNNPKEIRNALKKANEEKQRPTLIIGKTIMGKGAMGPNGESFERKVSTHGQPLSNAGADITKTIKKMDGNPDNPFYIFPEVKEYYVKALEEKIAYAREKKAEQQEWENAYPEMARKLQDFFKNEVPKIDYAAIMHKSNISTRAASGAILGVFAEKIENMIVASADLSNSDKTDGFLKNSNPFQPGDFSGGFLHAGVSELTMAALANGMATHGGVIPVCGTFFVFSDYMKPAIRMAALMELPVKYVFSHDSFRVGEDGPTHQPIEQEAQIRLLEQVKNHSGKRSFLALRPADAAETSVAWGMALKNTSTPTALILSRQNISDIQPEKNRFQEALEAQKGAYVISRVEGTPDVVLVGNGSEVSTLIASAELLQKENNLKIQIVSVISEGLFREQPKDYQQMVIPQHVPVFGLTAGLPSTLERLVGCSGRVYGMDHFGFSAPAHTLDEKFGYTAKNMQQKVLDYLEEYPVLIKEMNTL